MSRRFAWAARFALCAVLTLVFVAPLVAEEDEKDDGKKPARPQLGNRVDENLGREGMWPAPTAEDWASPCLIPFQRTWEDAIAVAKETGKPILICINMDGEIASEHWAGKRYRQPEVAELYSQYVTVIASVYRHTPRDYDDDGKRILCPRFGSVTCGEHIAIEPTIYEKFCDGQRVAPRHIAVDVEGNEAYDVYYINDTAGVFDSIIDGRAKFPDAKPLIVRGDRPIMERVASRHLADRQAVEAAYQSGDAETRRKLLEAAIKNPKAAPIDLLRLAIFGLDVDLSKTARQALAKVDTPHATQLISEAMQVPMEPSERDALIAALKRLGDKSELAQWLAGLHAGLAEKSKLDPSAWSKKPKRVAPTPTHEQLVAQAEYQAQAAESNPDDPGPRLQLAESSLALAFEAPRKYVSNQRLARQITRQMYVDAKREALAAEKLGATGWRVNSVLALAAYYTGDAAEAYKRADVAMKDLPADDSTWRSMALVTVFAESRFKAIKKAVKAKEDWPQGWLADLHAAYAILQRHPLGTADQVFWHYDFMDWLGAHHRATRILHEGIGRFRDSEKLHKALRERLMRRRGAKALETYYAELLKEFEDPARLSAYASLASLTVAEYYRRTNRYEKAIAGYERSIMHYEDAIQAHEAHKAFGDRHIALAHAAIARMAYQLDDDELATKEILKSFARDPSAAGTRDAMGFTPGETGQMLLARLKKAEKADLAAKVEVALSELDSALLRPDIGLGPGGR